MSELAAHRIQHTMPSLITWLAGAALLVGLGWWIAAAPLSWIIISLIGAASLLLILIHPMLGLYALAFAIPFGAMREISLGGLNVSPVELLIGWVAVAWLARMVAQRAIVITLPALWWPLMALLGAFALSLTVTTSLPASLKELFKWIEILIIYIYLAHEGSGRALKTLTLCLLLAASAEALLGLYQFWFQVGPEGFVLMGRFMRAYGTFRQPNPYAGYLGLHIPLAIGVLWADGQALWNGWRQRDWLRLILTWVALGSLALMVLAMIASWSRGGWMGMAASVGAMLLFGGRRSWALALVAVLLLCVALLIGGAALLPDSVTQRVTDTLDAAAGLDLETVEVDDNNWSLVERLAHWDAATKMFADHPWQGVGIGNYAVAYPRYALPRWQDPLGHAHNYVLNLAAETGLIGLAGYSVFWIAFFVALIRAIWHTPAAQRGYLLAALGIGAYLHIHNVVDNLYVQGMHLQVGVALSLLAIFGHPTKDIPCVSA